MALGIVAGTAVVGTVVVGTAVVGTAVVGTVVVGTVVVGTVAVGTVAVAGTVVVAGTVIVAGTAVVDNTVSLPEDKRNLVVVRKIVGVQVVHIGIIRQPLFFENSLSSATNLGKIQNLDH
jgi:ABC-type multidrug transport system permease subunit